MAQFLPQAHFLHSTMSSGGLQPGYGKTLQFLIVPDYIYLSKKEKVSRFGQDCTSFVEVSKAANRRFLDSLQGIVPAGSIEREINEVCGKRTVRGKTVTGYNVWSKETMQLFETISDGKYLIRGFTNKDIRSILYPQSQSDKKVRGKMSRTLSKLRAHGLIRKIPHSRKYLVTDKGRRVMGALIETKRKIYPDLAAS